LVPWMGISPLSPAIIPLCLAPMTEFVLSPPVVDIIDTLLMNFYLTNEKKFENIIGNIELYRIYIKKGKNNSFLSRLNALACVKECC